MNKFIGVLLILVLAASCKNETEPIVKITTEYGDIKIRLYDKTPKHRDNFLKLVEEKFYDGLLFHRVINHFMIQGGDPTSKNAGPDVLLGEGDVDYRIDAYRSISTRKGCLLPHGKEMTPIQSVSLAGRSSISFKETCILRNS